MDYLQKNPEIHDPKFRECMRDMLAYSSLATIWAGKDVDSVAKSLVEVLVESLGYDLAYASLNLKDRVSTALLSQADKSIEIPQDLLQQAITNAVGEPFFIPFLQDGLELRGLVLPIGYGDEMGRVLITSSRPDFPAEKDRVFIQLCMNQAFICFQNHKFMSAQEKAEDALRKSEQWLKRIVDSIPSAIYVCAQDGTILLYNKCAVELWGRTPTPETRYCASTRVDIGNGHWVLPDACPMVDVLEKGISIKNQEVVIERQDGSTVNVMVNIIPLFDRDGKIIGAINSLHDISEIKRFQRTLEKNEQELREALNQLERSNKELEQFAYVASHDLQEPLRMVTAYTQLLASRYKEKLDGEADKFINYATDGALRSQNLINDLLDYSRVRMQQKAFEKINCGEVFEAAISNLSIAIQESGATITHDVMPSVLGDKTKLTQLFQNLINNAIKFRGKDVPKVHIACHQNSSNEWVFSIKDNGIGIDPQYHDRIFVIFQRLHTRNQYAGTGIGLAICKKIVEQHHGKIWVESEQGKGSTFHFIIRKDES